MTTQDRNARLQRAFKHVQNMVWVPKISVIMLLIVQNDLASNKFVLHIYLKATKFGIDYRDTYLDSC